MLRKIASRRRPSDRHRLAIVANWFRNAVVDEHSALALLRGEPQRRVAVVAPHRATCAQFVRAHRQKRPERGVRAHVVHADARIAPQHVPTQPRQHCPTTQAQHRRFQEQLQPQLRQPLKKNNTVFMFKLAKQFERCFRIIQKNIQKNKTKHNVERSIRSKSKH